LLLEIDVEIRSCLGDFLASGRQARFLEVSITPQS